jgi:acetylornithine/succinyldiaminopimelate/putrescine aminotransferase
MVADVTFAPFNDLEAAEAAITGSNGGKDVAAIFVEPVQGEGGIYPAKPAFMQGLRRLADDVSYVQCNPFVRVVL